MKNVWKFDQVPDRPWHAVSARWGNRVASAGRVKFQNCERLTFVARNALDFQLSYLFYAQQGIDAREKSKSISTECSIQGLFPQSGAPVSTAIARDLRSMGEPAMGESMSVRPLECLVKTTIFLGSWDAYSSSVVTLCKSWKMFENSTKSQIGHSTRSPLDGWIRHGGVDERRAVGIFGENDCLPLRSWGRGTYTPRVWWLCVKVEKCLKIRLSPRSTVESSVIPQPASAAHRAVGWFHKSECWKMFEYVNRPRSFVGRELSVFPQPPSAVHKAVGWFHTSTSSTVPARPKCESTMGKSLSIARLELPSDSRRQLGDDSRRTGNGGLGKKCLPTTLGTQLPIFKPTPNSKRLHTVMSGTSWEIVIFFPLGCLVWVHSLEWMTDDGGRVMGPFWAVETHCAIRSVA